MILVVKRSAQEVTAANKVVLALFMMGASGEKTLRKWKVGVWVAVLMVMGETIWRTFWISTSVDCIAGFAVHCCREYKSPVLK